MTDVTNVTEVTKTVETVEAVKTVPVAQVSQPVASSFLCGDNQLAYEIYYQESRCKLDSVNSIDACGIGQALPCTKLSSVCPNWQTDYNCQNQFFTSYAMSYGSWQKAYEFKFCEGNCYSSRTDQNTYKYEVWW